MAAWPGKKWEEVFEWFKEQVRGQSFYFGQISISLGEKSEDGLVCLTTGDVSYSGHWPIIEIKEDEIEIQIGYFHFALVLPFPFEWVGVKHMDSDEKRINLEFSTGCIEYDITLWKVR